MPKFFFVDLISSGTNDNQIDTSTEQNTINADITNYWQNEEEIVFPIHRGVLQRLKQQSDLTPQLICLEVSNIEDPELVNVVWKPFGSTTLQANETLSYYILSETLLENLTNDVENILSARIYKTEDNKYGVFCQKAILNHSISGGTGNSGGTNSAGADLGKKKNQ